LIGVHQQRPPGRRGTLPYMAPELVSDPDRVSEKADVWSLGMVLWEMLCLETPFQALTPQQILAGLMVGNLAPEARPPSPRGSGRGRAAGAAGPFSGPPSVSRRCGVHRGGGESAGPGVKAGQE